MGKREMRGKGEVMGTSYNPSVPPKKRRAGPPKRRTAGRSDWVPPEVVCPKVRVKGSLAENQTDFILCDKD